MSVSQKCGKILESKPSHNKNIVSHNFSPLFVTKIKGIYAKSNEKFDKIKKLTPLLPNFFKTHRALILSAPLLWTLRRERSLRSRSLTTILTANGRESKSRGESLPSSQRHLSVLSYRKLSRPRVNSKVVHLTRRSSLPLHLPRDRNSSRQRCGRDIKWAIVSLRCKVSSCADARGKQM